MSFRAVAALALLLLAVASASDPHSFFSSLRVFSANLPACTSSNEFLLVVGDVGVSHARVLFEPLCSSAEPTRSRIKIRSPTLRAYADLSMTPGRTHVLQIDDLLPSTPYNISFDKHKVTFVTLPRGTSASSPAAASVDPVKLIFVSCDRWLEDGDSAFAEVIARQEGDRFGMVHMGDQVYADIVVRHAQAHGTIDTSNATMYYTGALHAFRDLYRRSWSRSTMRRVLRVGAHFMLPDDHDISNNLDPRMWHDRTKRPSEYHLSHVLESGSAVKIAIAAGRQAYYEYQYQLQFDWSADQDPLVPSSQHNLNSSLSCTPVHDNAPNSVHLNPNSISVQGNTIHISAQPLNVDAAAAAEPPVPMIQHQGRNPFPVYFARRFGATGVVFLDLRFQRTFFSSDVSPLLGDDQLDFVRHAIKEFDLDSGITEVLVVSSIPLIFHHPRLAELADNLEGERYATHPAHLKDLSKLLTSIMFVPGADGARNFTSSKLRLTIGGDLHMFADSDVCVQPSESNEFVFVNAAPKRHDDSAFQLSSIFGSTSFKPESPDAQCVGQMVTSGITRGSTTASSFKLWLFTFLNVNIFPSEVEVLGVDGGMRPDSADSLMAWVASFFVGSRGRQSDSSATMSADVSGSTVAKQCVQVDDLVDTEDESQSADCQQPTQASSTGPAREAPDFALRFRQFFFGLNYGVVLLPPQASYTFAESVFAPIEFPASTMVHPEAPAPTNQRSAGPPVMSHVHEDTSRPYSPVTTTVRTRMRRHGNVVWFAEAGVPLPIAWLVLQLAFENVLQILGATVAVSLLVWVLFKYSQAHNGPQRDDVVTLQELLTRRVKPAVQSRRAKK